MTLFTLALVWLIGIGLGARIPLSTPQWMILAALALAARLLIRRGRSALVFGGLLVLFSGAARFQSNLQPPTPDAVRWLNDTGHAVQLTGIVADYPDVRDAYTGLRVRVQQVELDGQPRPAQGLVLVYADRAGGWAYGDVVTAFGRLETPPEFPDFSYREYLARQGVHSQMPRAGVTRLASGRGNPVLQRVYAYRARAQVVLRALVPEPEASLLSGILLGIESGIPADLRQAYNTTGTAHIIAISGFNIAIIAGLFGKLFTRWFGARRGTRRRGAGDRRVHRTRRCRGLRRARSADGRAGPRRTATRTAGRCACRSRRGRDLDDARQSVHAVGCRFPAILRRHARIGVVRRAAQGGLRPNDRPLGYAPSARRRSPAPSASTPCSHWRRR